MEGIIQPDSKVDFNSLLKNFDEITKRDKIKKLTKRIEELEKLKADNRIDTHQMLLLKDLKQIKEEVENPRI